MTQVCEVRTEPDRGMWTGYAAAVWALAFTALSVYWACGGTVGEGTIGAAIEGSAVAREPDFVLLLWVTAVLKFMAVLLALTLIGRLFRWVPRWMRLTAGWVAAVLLLGYGLANLVQHLLMWTGAVAVPDGLGSAALPWHLLLWDPIWIVGGILFTATAIYASSKPRRPFGSDG
ncbi:DUF3995 domain-containing protein [Actinoplanes sp. NEAU-A12]|uniref:DUF3995 domain-containing protein n=1 Tax=Actinoplanes sandaracinus TaxID=3045177 RepID=A0ABT6WHQ5_9ACTN|nr:DUF3995 domain-containing protein [Actinoplanes sandaracinus]MDI6099267.1 DUF3995 domain-containing protein [Actinoplanes sandaracinus]